MFHRATDLRHCLLFSSAILLFALSLTAQQTGVSYSIRYDAGHQLWVQIHNQSENVIVVRLISIEFRNSSGLIELRQIRCEHNCRIIQKSSKDFGPLGIPKGTTEVRVSEIKFSPEN